MNDFDRPTRKDIEDILVEIEETIYVLQRQSGFEDAVRNLEEQAERLKRRLANW